MPRVLIALLAGAAALSLVGCTPGGRTGHAVPSPIPPCGSGPAVTVALGDPYRGTRPPAHFQTSGGPLYLTAHGFNHGGVFDPDRASTAFSIGPADTPPSYDTQRGTVTPLAAGLSVKEGSYGRIELPAGRYWLWSSNGGGVEIVSCTPGALTGTPVPAGGT
jgi:hypothetical protein